MKITIDTDPYNHRRYGRPWIAKVDFSRKASGEFEFGQWVGADGQAGLLTIEAEVGDVLASGQRDTRGRQDPPEYAIVGASIESSGYRLIPAKKVDAYRHFMARAATPPEPQQTKELTEELMFEFTEGRQCGPDEKSIVVICGPGCTFNENNRFEFTPECAEILAQSLLAAVAKQRKSNH